MAYFWINNKDFSMYVNKLKVGTEHIFKGRTNASGNTIVKRINTKRTIEVGIIPVDAEAMEALLAEINKFTVTLAYKNPETNLVEDNVKCMISNNIVEYYTIQESNVKFKAFALTFTEL